MNASQSDIKNFNKSGFTTNVEYVCRLFRIPNPLPRNDIGVSNGNRNSNDEDDDDDYEGRQCGTLESWSLADTLLDRAQLERDCRARLGVNDKN